MNDLNHMELKEAHDFYKTWYTPNNAVVVVAGDVNPEKVYELAKQYFGPLTPHPVPSMKPVPLQKTVSKKWVDVSLPAQLPFLFMGYEVPSHGSEPHSLEPYALEVMAAILDGDGSARLTRHLLRDEEIATAADAQYSLYNRYSGLFLLLGIPTPAHSIDELRESFLKEIKDLKTTLVPEEELRRIKMRLIATKTYDKDSLSTVAFELGNTAILGLPLEEVAAYERKIQSVTPEDIQAVAKKYFTKENLSVATLIPLPTNPSETSSTSTPSGEFHHGT
jgi:zinc protease